MSNYVDHSLINQYAVDGICEYVTVRVMDQLFGIPIRQVREVFTPDSITDVPLSAPEIAGVLNLRGMIVTAIDMRVRLNLPPLPSGASCMAVGIDDGQESYCLLVDSVDEVMRLPVDSWEQAPVTLDDSWAEISAGVHRLDRSLLVVVQVKNVLNFSKSAAA